MESQNNNSFSGQLNKSSIPYLLVYLQNNRLTGTLDINSKYGISIFTDQGNPYFAAGGSDETLLGKILLNKNKITKYQYDRAVEEIKNDEDNRIGEILVNLGMITPHELYEYLEIQLREKIVESFLYLEGEFKFTATNEVRDDLYYSKLDPSEIIHDGFNRYVYAADTNLDLIEIEIKNNIQEEISTLGLGPKELRLVQLLGQKNSLNEIGSTGQFKKDDILRVILLLGLHDRIEFKSIKINDFLIDVFKKYSELNPLPNPVSSNYTVRESELTDPTGEVLLLDDELEATADREKPDLGKDEIKEKKDDEALTNPEPEIKTEVTTDYIDPPVDNKPSEMDFVELNMDSDGEEKVDINNNINEHSFQDSYEGTQKSIEIEKGSNDELSSDTSVVSTQSEQTGEDLDYSEKDIISFYERIQDKEDYYEILNIKKDASVDEIKEAYFISIKKFHPDANMNFPEEIRVKSERIFTKVTKAYEILSDEHKRNNFDEKEELSKFREQANSIYEAEIIYSEGEMLLRQRNFKEAEKKFIEAIELNPDESAYVGINAWAKYLGAQDKEVVFEDVKKELKNAIEMDKNIAENYYYLGSIYKFSENLASAEKFFAMAIEKDPNYIEAKRELRLLKSRKGENVSSKGSSKKIEKKFWSGLFKK